MQSTIFQSKQRTPTNRFNHKINSKHDWINVSNHQSKGNKQTNTNFPKPQVARNAICFHMMQFQTNIRESYISYACGSSKVICNIQTNIAIEAPKTSGYSRHAAESLWKISSGRSVALGWLCIANGYVNTSRVRQYGSWLLAIRSGTVWPVLLWSVVWKQTFNRDGLRLGSERDNNARHWQKDKAVNFNSPRSSRWYSLSSHYVQ